MKRATLFLLLCLGMGTAKGADLYHVTVQSLYEATILKATGVEPALYVPDGYLVLADSSAGAQLVRSGLTMQLLATEVTKENLKVSRPGPNDRLLPYSLLYEAGGLQIYHTAVTAPELLSLSHIRTEIEWVETPPQRPRIDLNALSLPVPLDSLISLVSMDSIHDNLETLVSFGTRRCTSPGNATSRDWLAAKFRSYGYVPEIDEWDQDDGFGVWFTGENVIAVKRGSRYPNVQVVVGAHRDAVQRDFVNQYPGADDDGSGTVAVLEMARVLANIETPVTIIFALFDAEEEWMLGSYHFVRDYKSTRNIEWMLNLDMIGNYQNCCVANVYHGSDSSYAQLWAVLSDSLLPRLTGILSRDKFNSDLTPFDEIHIPWVWAEEFAFSPVYHMPFDDLDHISFPYLTDMTKASLATLYTSGFSVAAKPTLAVHVVDRPSRVTPGVPQALHIAISELNGNSYTLLDPSLHYRLADGPWVTVPLTQSQGELYDVSLPALMCEDTLLYYVSVSEATSGKTTLVPDTTVPFVLTAASNTNVIFADDFETDKGWTTAGTAASGMWERGVPTGGGLWGDPPSTPNCSGQCFLTGNTGPCDDVDSGLTYLISPRLDLSQGDATVSFMRWFSNDFHSNPGEDVFRIRISNDDGATWRFVEIEHPWISASGGWIERQFRVSDYVTPSDAVRIRFEASDYYRESNVEAALDDFVVTRTSCVNPSCCSGTTGNVNMLGVVDLTDLSMLISYLWGQVYPLPCDDEANLDGRGVIDLVDLSLLIAYLTQGRPLPACSGANTAGIDIHSEVD